MRPWLGLHGHPLASCEAFVVRLGEAATPIKCYTSTTPARTQLQAASTLLPLPANVAQTAIDPVGHVQCSAVHSTHLQAASNRLPLPANCRTHSHRPHVS